MEVNIDEKVVLIHAVVAMPCRGMDAVSASHSPVLSPMLVTSLNQAKGLAPWWYQTRDEVLEVDVLVRTEVVVQVKVEAQAVVNAQHEVILLAMHRDIA